MDYQDSDQRANKIQLNSMEANGDLISNSDSGSLEVSASSTSSMDTLDNGDFETGSLSPWTTGSTYSASVSSGSYHVYEGPYGARLAEYDGSVTYYPAYVQQSVNIFVEELDQISLCAI